MIGEGPGRAEVEAHEVFAGPTGEELREALGSVDIDRRDVLLINAIGCIPPDGLKTSQNMLLAAKACQPWMRSILKGKVARGTPTLTMGKWATYLIRKKALAVSNRRGFLRYDHPRFFPWVMTWHPTFALFYNPFEKGAFMADLDRWARAIRGELVLPEVQLNIKPTLKDLIALRSEPFITCDIETGGRSPSTPWTGKDPTQAKLKVVGFGTPDRGLAIWWDDAAKQMRDETRRLLADGKILKVLQNGPWFDNRVLARYGMEVNNYMDTRDMRRAISTTSRLSLGYMGSLYLDIEDWKMKGGDDEK